MASRLTVEVEDVEAGKPHRIWLDTAERDLSVARELFAGKSYSHCVFFLEQSVEKAVKSFGIWTKTITEEEARDIVGHRVVRIYVKSLNKFLTNLLAMRGSLAESPKFEDLRATAQAYENELLSLIGKLQKDYLDEEVALKISYSREALQDIISRILDLRVKVGKDLAELETTASKLGEKETEEIKKSIARFIDFFSEIDALNKEEERKKLDEAINPQAIAYILRKIFKPLVRIRWPDFALFYLGAILCPHVGMSRYPNGESNPASIYTDQMPLVEMLVPLIDIADESLKALAQVYSDLSRKRGKITFSV